MKYLLKDNSIFFEELPFYWHPLVDVKNNQFPETLPMEVYFDPQMGMIRQKINNQIIKLTASLYDSGTELPGLMDDQGIGFYYFQDFMSFIDRNVGLSNFEKLKVLEIGCGTGFLLSQLKNHKCDILGCDPGFSKLGKYKVPVIEESFPCESLDAFQFDIIIACSFLEHVVDIENVLMNFKGYLKKDGVLLLAVPNEEESLTHGDISMIFHEHFSYFTKTSFESIMQKNGFSSLCVEKSRYAASIYGAFRVETAEDMFLQNDIAKNYILKTDIHIKKLVSFFKKYENKEIGIYVPVRAMNILVLCRDLLAELNISLRLFDDLSSLRGKYLPGINIAIENRESLMNCLSDVVLVYSFTFGEKIVNELKAAVKNKIEIISINEL